MTDEQLKWNIKTSMNEINGSDEEKSRAAALFDTAQTVQKTTGNYHRIPGIAAAAIALVFILALGSVGVFAMTGSFSFRDFFFKNSEQQFEEVYTEAHKELILDEYKIVFEGSIYDESVDQGSLSFSVWDLQNNPVELNGNQQQLPTESLLGGINTLSNFRLRFKLGNDEWGIMLSGVRSLYTMLDGNNYFVMFSRIDLGKEPFEDIQVPDFQFALLKKEDLINLKKDFSEFHDIDYSHIEKDPDTQEYTVITDYNSAYADYAQILSKYDMVSIESKALPTQVIQVENLKLTVGRINMIFEYNANECTVKEFYMIREDGTRTRFWQEDFADNKTNNAGGFWKVEGVRENAFGGGPGNLNADFKLSYNYGFILGNDEKVKIEADGRIYE